MSIERQLGELTDIIVTFKNNAHSRIDKIQAQADAIDLRLAKGADYSGPGGKSLKGILEENESVERLLRDRKGRATIRLEGADANLLSTKSVVTSAGLGYTTTGVLGIERTPGIVTEARQGLKIRQLLTARPTTMQVIDYVKVSTPFTNASPQVESLSKFENTFALTSASERVKTLATFCRTSRQVLDDVDELRSFIETGLSYYVDNAEELEILAGSGVGEHLNGLIPQASAFSTGLLPSSWNTMDIIGRAIQQTEEAKELSPTFVVLNPRDWWTMRMTKDGFGRYVLGDPQATVRPTLFGRDVIDTTNITAGTFLLGSGDPAAVEIRDRMETTVDISTEDADNFTKNLVTILVEKGVALIVRRPASFIRGSLTSSPAA